MKTGLREMTVYYITLERISTGERSESLVVRTASEQAAHAYAVAAIGSDTDLRIVSIRTR
jgi:predicted dinucleotide-utilizing enzyme